MKTQNDSWSLFRLSDRKQFDRVPLQVIEYLHKLLPESDHKGWMFWKEPLTDWQPLARLPAILKHEMASPETPIPPPAPTVEFESATVDPAHEKSMRSHVSKLTKAEKAEQPLAATHAEVEDLSSSTKSQESLREKSKTTSNTVSKSLTKTQLDKTGDVILSKSQQASEDAEQLRPRKHEPAARLQPAASVPQPKVISMATGEQTLSLMLESKLASEDRSMVRYQKRFKVRINLPDGRVFESVTVDASQSGMRLRDQLPEGLPRFFSVEFDCGTEGKIPLMCSVIKERDGKKPFRLRIQVNDFQNKLRSALMRAS
ncbi:MAG: PilZ domain-containing protein [Bdellovibrionaceae bacterium]|nr:PilZ domain-containing protein [Pseudobdellovibrionaceae bacterium]